MEKSNANDWGLLIAQRVEALFCFCRRTITSDRTAYIGAKGEQWGNVVFVAGLLLGFLASIVHGVRSNQLWLIPASLVGIAAAALAQYIALLFLSGARSLLAQTRSSIASEGFLIATAAIGLLMLVLGPIGGIAGRGVLPFLIGIAISVSGWALVGASLNPSLVSVEVKPGTAGEEAIGALALFAKFALLLLPVVFFFFCLAGGILSLAEVVGVEIPISALGISFPGILGGISTLVTGCLVVVVVYLLFLISYIGIDVISSILALPRSVERIREKIGHSGTQR